MSPSIGQLRALLARQESSHFQFRKRVARRLHDEISQKLTLLTLQLALESSAAANSPNAAAKKRTPYSALISELSQSIREITTELEPRVLDELGIVAALQWYARAEYHAVPCTFHSSIEDAPLSAPVATDLFCAVREIVELIFQPAGVALIEIILEHAERQLRIQVRGLGKKATTIEPSGAFSLDILCLQERLLRHNGLVALKPIPAGMSISLTVPTPGPSVAKMQPAVARHQ